MRPGPIPVFAEMSSIDPVAVLTTALEKRGEHIATELAASVVLGCGEFLLTLRSIIFQVLLRKARHTHPQLFQEMLS